MENIRSGNLKVSKMKKEIEKSIVLLELLYQTPRRERQINDGERFLNMISKLPYANCKTVSQLKKKISEERQLLKQELLDSDYYMPGHQFTIFELAEEVSEEEKERIKIRTQELNEQIHWLHKCLGMCSNRSYFK